MIWNPFKLAPKRFLGVDVGTSSIKIVELSRAGKRKKLNNYGEMLAAFLYEKSFRTFEKNTLILSVEDIANAIRTIIKKAGMQSKKAYFPIPDFSSFFTLLELPPMSQEEIPQAIEYQARQHIPLPLSEITLDWKLIEEGKALLVAVPNEVVYQYQQIAKKSQLELVSLEAEVFSLARALVKEDSPLVLVDIGARSTTCSIVEKRVVKISHSFDTGGNDFTNVVSKALNVTYSQAEVIKRKRGLRPNENRSLRQTLLPLVDLILQEIIKINQSYFRSERKEIQKVILAGGSALLPGLADYFSENLEKPVVIGDPFADLYYPSILEGLLQEMGPSYSIAVGAALYGFQ